MKKFFYYLPVVAGAMMLLLTACSKKEDKATVSLASPNLLAASANTVTLDKAKVNANDTSVLFTITKADFGYTAAVTYTLQIDSAGDNWKKPQSVTFTANATTKSFTTADFNNVLLKLNLPTTANSQVQARVTSSVANSIATQYSNTLTMTVRPFNLTAYVYVPGAYQGWDPSSADSLVSPTGNGIYTGVINFIGSDLNFKITPARNWNSSYGAGTTTGTVSLTGGNLMATANGGMLLTLNTNTNTLTIAPQWSIIGDATPGGWGGDTNMFLDKTNNTWYLNTTLINDGTKYLKFRFANDWAVNLGGSNGVLTAGGSNILIPTATTTGNTYRVTLNPTANTYTIVK